MLSIRGCFCAAPRSSASSKQQRKTETAHCRTACANSGEKGGCEPLTLEMHTGRTWTLPRPLPTRKACSSATSARTQSRKGSPMFSIPPKARLPLPIAGISVSGGLFAYLVWRAGPNLLWQNLEKLGWGFTAVLALAGISHLAKTWAWQLTLGKDKEKVSFPRLVGLRLGAEAAGQLGILGQTFGDSIRVVQLSREISMGNSLASVALDRGFFVITAIIVIIAGILMGMPMLSGSHALPLYAGIFVFGAVALLLLALLTVRRRWPLYSGSARLLGRVPSLKGWVDREFDVIESMENAMFDFYHNAPKAFWASFSLNLTCQLLAVLEVCVILSLLGANIGFIGALTAEALTKLVNTIGSFNPGNIGTYEGGNMLIGKMFSLGSTTGLALALA